MNLNILTLEREDNAVGHLGNLSREAFAEATIVETRTHEAAKRSLRRRHFDVVILDWSQAQEQDTALIEQIRAEHRNTYPIIFTHYDDSRHIMAAFRAGAMGYLLSDLSTEVLVEKLRKVPLGEPPMAPSVVRFLLHSLFHESKPQDSAIPLTTREEEILVLLSRGFSRRDMAETLHLSRHTISCYIKDLYRKIGVSSRAEAAVTACQIGLIRLS